MCILKWRYILDILYLRRAHHSNAHRKILKNVFVGTLLLFINYSNGQIEMNIFVNVYDLDDGGNSTGAAMLRGMNMGLHHTGVEIGGHEYSFSAAGVSRTRPQLPEFGLFRERLFMGSYPGVLHEIHDIIAALSTPAGGFGPGMYNVLTKNCNHFSDALCMALLNVHIPDWINRAAGVGSSIANRVAPASSSTPAQQKTEAFLAPGVVAPPSLNRKGAPSESLPLSPIYDPTPDNNGRSWFAGLKSVFSWASCDKPEPTLQAPANHSAEAAGATRNSITTTNNSSKAAQAPDKKKELSAKQKQLLEQLKKS